MPSLALPRAVITMRANVRPCSTRVPSLDTRVLETRLGFHRNMRGQRSRVLPELRAESFFRRAVHSAVLNLRVGVGQVSDFGFLDREIVGGVFGRAREAYRWPSAESGAARRLDIRGR